MTRATARSTAASRSAPRRAEPDFPPLARYREKRNFDITPEPGPEPAAGRRGQAAGHPPGKRRGAPTREAQALSFVIQKHWASHLHYDFRLELDGVLLSWAVPKGPSLDPADKRMAIHVEDHPVAYGGFEGTIPEGQYGAGQVIVWDRGTWEPVDDPHRGLAAGKLAFRLHGDKLSGLWELVKIAKGGERQEPWLLFKKRDEFARPKAEFDVIAALPDSVLRTSVRGRAMPSPSKATKPRASKAEEAASKPTATAPLPSPARGPSFHGVTLAGAVKAPLPDQLKPQLATLATGVPAEGRWLFEVKFDGYRIMARIQRGKARLITRGGHDWSDRMPGLVKELSQLGLKSGWLDGEIVMLNEAGTPDFNALQKAFDRPASSAEVVYFLFDLPFADGLDLREVPLVQRRQALQAVLDAASAPHLRYSADFQAAPGDLLQSACRMKLEGVIAKREDARYASRRTETWLKLKCKQRQEFVVCGYTDRSDGSPQIGSLLLGVHDDSGALVSAGSVGTGWSSQEARALKQQLQPLEVDKSPFAAPPGKPGRWSRRVAGTERWVTPQRVAEVEFAEWTPDGQVRHAAYVSMRTDKPAKAITRETPREVETPALVDSTAARSASAARPTRARPAVDAVKVTHGDRVIDPGTGLTKLALVRYYESVAPWILPHLKGRPVSLVRAPAGINGQIFFQKHDDKLSIPGLKSLPPDLWPEHPPLLEVPDVRALLSAAQMNVVEFHTWNAPSRRVALPDRLVFDLDPGEGTGWPHVQEAATLVRALLEELGLQSWLKTSGGKGLHVVVPITPRLDYDTVKAFSKAVVQHMAQTLPQRFVAKPGGSHRVGKIFIDYLRNGFGQTTAAAFSARARPGMGVSMPVAWEQLGELKSGAQWTITNAREYLSLRREDPWEGFARKRQSLAKGMKALGVMPAESAARTIGAP